MVTAADKFLNQPVNTYHHNKCVYRSTTNNAKQKKTKRRLQPTEFLTTGNDPKKKKNRP